MTSNISRRIEKLEQNVTRKDRCEERREVQFLFDETDKLRLQGHPECSYNAIEANYKTLIDLCIEEGGNFCSFTKLSAEGKLDKIILQACKGGCTYANN